MAIGNLNEDGNANLAIANVIMDNGAVSVLRHRGGGGGVRDSRRAARARGDFGLGSAAGAGRLFGRFATVRLAQAGFSTSQLSMARRRAMLEKTPLK